MHRRIILSLFLVSVLAGAGLPEKGPLPTTRPVTVEERKVPEKIEPENKEEEPKVGPVPQDKPSAPTKDANPSDAKPSGDEPEAKAAPEPAPTIQPEEAKEYAACLVQLKAIGAMFREEKRIDDGKGCGIDRPLTLQSVLPGIALKPEGRLRCETALELARWTRDAVLPAAKVALEGDGPLTVINQASSYICRLRNNAAAGKISEHARGNAIDIASFTFKNGKSMEIQPRDEDSTLAGAFQRAVTAAGCLYFRTVLDPGSDAAHENHLHFDVIERGNGYRYCR